MAQRAYMKAERRVVMCTKCITKEGEVGLYKTQCIATYVSKCDNESGNLCLSLIFTNVKR